MSKPNPPRRSVLPMFTVLKSERDLVAWARKNSVPCFAYSVAQLVADGQSRSQVLRDRALWLQQFRPLSYPVAVIRLVTSCQYQETEPFYLGTFELLDLLKRINPRFAREVAVKWHAANDSRLANLGEPK